MIDINMISFDFIENEVRLSQDLSPLLVETCNFRILAKLFQNHCSYIVITMDSLLPLKLQT